MPGKLTRADLGEQLVEDRQISFGFSQNCEVPRRICHETPLDPQTAQTDASDLPARQIGCLSIWIFPENFKRARHLIAALFL